MLLTEQFKSDIDHFIRQPFPLWENELTAKLVNSAYLKLESAGIHDRPAYSTTKVLTGQDAEVGKQFLATYGRNAIYLEEPDEIGLAEFYEEHGLLPLSKRQLIKEKAATKLKAALLLLASVPECINCITSLVNCIQIIASEGPDYDTSYSHPNLPFTIFVSVCINNDNTSSLRVAEGILHEAMHLKLSLIQQHIVLIRSDLAETFYSPWRDEQRPLNGVLHGIFVFRAIQEFFKILNNNPSIDNRTRTQLSYRITDIYEEFKMLQNFDKCSSLTKDGANLSANLLPWS
ncbi:HEXXH motif-containing putative peptide modification protein [Mucilaginibacter sp. AW1-7]|uniref:aKG-HExxH-type peptide beta-hydroxylase n=1 Tax=Mucilaginibacter sp. AW1-7 TaxID=3349874 RepID=UPI003F738B05